MLGRVVCASLLLVLSASARADDAVPLSPVGKWNVDYAVTRCTAARSFGNASDSIILGIIPSINGGTYELLVSRPKRGPALADELNGSVDFGRGPIKSLLLYYGAKGTSYSTYRYRISAAEMQQARSARTVTLHASGREDYAFLLTDMPAVLDTLQNCTTDLQQYWNMGAKNSTATEKNKGSHGRLRTLFSGDDYPAEALKMREEGKGQYELLVDEKGAVEGCDVLIPTGVALLDVMACKVMMERAKFVPSIDANGKPVRSVYTTPPIAWNIR